MANPSSTQPLSFFAVLCLLLSSSTAASFSDDRLASQRVLVLLDDAAIKSSHSMFFKSLSDRGYNLDFRLAYDPAVALQKYGEYLYESVILFAPTSEKFGRSIDLAAVLDFIDSGHDLILAADVVTSDIVRDIAAECGVDFEEDSEALVIDHFNFAASKNEADHTLIFSDLFIDSPVLLGNEGIQAPVLFRGIAHSANPANSLVIKVLSASPSAYSANPEKELVEPPSLSGSSIGLISVVQTRNNARILISGSLDLFSNRLFQMTVQKFDNPTSHLKSGNEQFAVELSKWTFHERGHLKAVNVRHHKVGEIVEPAMYRISDDLEYCVEIYEWTGKYWKPYNADDVQLQFYMMSPYVLTTLMHDNKGVYSTAFKVPDVYGVFQFKVVYRRLGYTALSLSKQIPVRPFRHNEYERFIRAAFPYYGAAFSMMFGFFTFSIVFLYHK